MTETVGDIRFFVECLGCKRSLLRSELIGVEKRADGTVWDWKKRPWSAVVPTRASPPYGSKDEGLPLHERPLDGPPIVLRELPTVCSRQCLDAVRAMPKFATCNPMPGTSDREHASELLRDGDDVLCLTLGSAGPMPGAPSDEWLDPPKWEPPK